MTVKVCVLNTVYVVMELDVTNTFGADVTDMGDDDVDSVAESVELSDHEIEDVEKVSTFCPPFHPAPQPFHPSAL